MVDLDALWRRRLELLVDNLLLGEREHREIANLAEQIATDYRGRFLVELLMGEPPQLLDPIDTYDRRSADTEELAGGQPFRHALHRLAHQVGALGHVEAYVVPGGFDPLDLDGTDDRDAAAGPDHEAIRLRVCVRRTDLGQQIPATPMRLTPCSVSDSAPLSIGPTLLLDNPSDPGELDVVQGLRVVGRLIVLGVSAAERTMKQRLLVDPCLHTAFTRCPTPPVRPASPVERLAPPIAPPTRCTGGPAHCIQLPLRSSIPARTGWSAQNGLVPLRWFSNRSDAQMHIGIVEPSRREQEGNPIPPAFAGRPDRRGEWVERAESRDSQSARPVSVGHSTAVTEDSRRLTMHACSHRVGGPHALAILLAAVVGLTACGIERQAATSNGSSEPDIVSGSYRITAVLGEDSLEGCLDVRSDGEGTRGRVTLHVGRDLHFAIRAEDAVGDTARFLASSPARRLSLRWNDNTVEGELDLGGGRIAALTGSMDGPYPAELDDHFALDPIEGLEPARVSSGRSFPTLTARGDRVLFSQYEEGDFSHQTMMVANRQGVGWEAPSVASFSGQYSDRAPMLNPSTGDLIFASTRPLPHSDRQAESYNLWRIEGWARDPAAEPEPLSPVNSTAADYQPSVTSGGVLFFVSDRDGNQDIYRAELDEGAWSTPLALPDPVNTPDAEMSVFAAQDGSYIIFSSASPRDDHAGNEDLYISRWTGAGWSTPRNLGLPVNSFANEYGAYVSADGEWLYFTSDRTPPARLYRVEASRYLDGMRPRDE